MEEIQEQTIGLLITHDLSEFFYPTQYLRHLKTKPRKVGYYELKLQQMWQGSNGTQEWREVEVVEEQ